MNKKLIAVVLVGIVLLLGMGTLCLKLWLGGQEPPEDETPPEEQVIEVETPAYPEDIPEELGNTVTKSVNTFIKGSGFLPYLICENTEYLTEETILEAMKATEQFKPLVISDELTLFGYEKQAKDHFVFTFTSEMGSNVSLSYLKIDENWLIDVSSLVTDTTFRVPSGIPIKINGVVVDNESYTSGTTIEVKGVLKSVPVNVSYDTGLYKNYNEDFMCTEETQDARYMLVQDDIDKILPQVESLWRGLQAMVVAETPDNHWNLFYPETKITADAVLSAWGASVISPVAELALQGFDLNKSEGVIPAYLESKDTISLSLVGQFLKVQGVADAKTIYNWVKVVKEDNIVKLYDCSAEAWLGSGL